MPDKENKAVPAYMIKTILPGSSGFSLGAKDINGGFLPGRSVLHWPSLKQIRLREAEKSPSGYILRVKGLKRSLVREGDLLLPGDWDICRGGKAVFYCPQGRERDGKRETLRIVRDPLGRPRGLGEISYEGYLARVVFNEKFPLVKGGVYRFQGLEEPLILLMAGDLPRSTASFAGKALTSWKDRDDLFREFLALDLGLNQFARLPREHRDISLPRCERGENVLIRSDVYKKKSRALLKKASAMGGADEGSIRDPLEQAVMNLMVERKGLLREKGWLLAPDAEGDRAKNLSPMARRQLEMLQEGTGRLSPASVKEKGGLDNWKALGRMGLVRFSQDLIMTTQAYEELNNSLTDFLKESGPSPLGKIREQTALSRREILVVLDWMEKDGLIINRDDIREAVR